VPIRLKTFLGAALWRDHLSSNALRVRVAGFGFARDALAQARADWQGSPGVRHVVLVTAGASFNAGLLIPILPLFLISRGFSLLQLGGLFSAVAVGALVVQLVAARFPQALGRPALVLGLAFVPVVVTPLYLVVRSPAQFLALAALGSFAAAASAPGVNALIARAAPIHGHARIFAYFGMLTGLTYAAAILVAYALASRGFAPVFALATLCSLSLLALTAWLAWRAHARSARARARRDALSPEERALFERAIAARDELENARRGLARANEGLLRLLPAPAGARRNVALVALHVLLFALSLAIYPVYFPLFLAGQGLPPAWIGPVIAASWIAAALAQPLGPFLAARIGRPRAILVGSLVAAALLNALFGVAPLAIVIAAWVLFGVADGVGRPLAMAFVAQNAWPGGPVASFSWTEAAATLGRIAAPYALALVIASQGLAVGFRYAALAILLSAVPFLLLATPRDATRDAPVARGEPA